MANDTLKRISEDICNEYLGFAPTTNATKPPHIANGLFRRCTGETCDTRSIHEWVISDSRNKSTSSEEIIKKYEDILQNGYNEKASNIKEFRLLLDDIFDQDNAVYPSYEFSVMTISSHWMIKNRVSPEGNIGDFVFEILSKKLDGKQSPIIKLVQNALENDEDDITKLVKPIIAMPSDKEKRKLEEIDDDDSSIVWNPVKQTLRDGFDRLADNIIKIGEDKNSLVVLKRVVNFSIFATFLYLINCNSALYTKGGRPPIVIDSGNDLESIKKASEQSYTIAKKSVEDYFANAIREWLKPIIPANTVEECNKWIDSIIFSSAERESSIKPALKSYFDSFCEEKGFSPLASLSRALQIVLYTFEYKNNSPSDFCRVLGVRSGLIGPKGNRAKTKRYLVNSFTLETITLSALENDELIEGLELKDLGEKLLKAYNILIGADAEKEYAILEEYNIAQSTPGDLRGDLSVNAQQLANTYISLGLGKKYADGVTLIGWRL